MNAMNAIRQRPRLRLGADIGGTKSLLALGRGARPALVRRYENDAFPSFDELLEDFLREAGVPPGVLDAACFAVAAPVTSQRVRLTNRADWVLDAPALAARYGMKRVQLINDFAAVAHGLPTLAAADMDTLQPGDPAAGGVRVAIGPGTGLGVAAIAGGRVLASEGGHVGFAPTDGAQAELWRFMGGEHRRVSNERICSGAGLVACYNFSRMRSGHALEPALAPAEVTRRADESEEHDAVRAIDLFTHILGAVAGDMALSFLARGGVYLVGGIVPKLRAHLRRGPFLAGFNAKSEHQSLVAMMPVHAVLVEDVGLRGAYAAAGKLHS